MAYRGLSDRVALVEVPASADEGRRLFVVPGLRESDEIELDPVGPDPAATPADAAALDAGERLARAQTLIADKRLADARALLDPAFLPDDAAVDTQIAWAEALAHAGAPDTAEALFEALLARNPRNRRVKFAFARRLHTRGLLMRAAALVEPEADVYPAGSAPRAFIERVLHLRAMLRAHEARDIGDEKDCRMLAMRHALAMYRDRATRPLASDRLGRMILVTGSLGPGGAERQLTRLAAELERARQRGEAVAGVTLAQPVEVLVRSHGPEQQNDFFLADLRAADVVLDQINGMKPSSTPELAIADKDLEALLDYLPIKVNFGMRRLVAHFRQRQPDVVSIWQDGACLFAGLAAVVAGVPRIQLVMRGLPPIIRKHMFLPEYEVMYRAIAAVPGVEFVSNSRAAARAYAEWLDIPVERFAIVYNGVPRMGCEPTEALEAQWRAFAERTADATHTVGGVFRFDTDKRPVTWIRFAARYYKRHPDARFVIVGAGRLMEESVRVATELGVAERILFVGRSTDVGYWIKTMDVLVLMSCFEGLPNVLIESQLLGVPVVSTPAGGAAECFIEGVTGHVLGCADKTDLDEACDKVQALVGRAQDEAIFGPAHRDFLAPNFAVDRMLENFMRVASVPPRG